LRARRRPRLVLFALRHIDAGEELFLDYGSEYWRDRPSPLASGIRGRQKPMRSIESSDQTA
jgi:SET domain-containing protein